MKTLIHFFVVLKRMPVVIVASAWFAGHHPMPASEWIPIDFDTVGNWYAGSGLITSYQTDHRYIESGWEFTGGPAVRQTTSETNGAPGAFGSYGWRLRETAGTVWGGTWQDGFVGKIRFDVRAWNETADIDWIIRTSSDGGLTFSDVFAINRTLLSGVEWTTVEVNIFATAYGDMPETWLVFELARVSGERILIDNFAFSQVPEPKSIALLLGTIALGCAVRRRVQRSASCRSWHG